MNRIPHPTVGRIQYEFARSATFFVLFIAGIVLGLNFLLEAVDRSRAGLPFSVLKTAREMFGNQPHFKHNLPRK